MIIRVENWDRRQTLCKQYGFRAAIVYDQPQSGLGFGAPACEHRIRAKEWLAQRYGQPMTQRYEPMTQRYEPMTQHYNREWICTDSAWLAYKSRETEYTIAVKDPKIRDWLLLL